MGEQPIIERRVEPDHHPIPCHEAHPGVPHETLTPRRDAPVLVAPSNEPGKFTAVDAPAEPLPVQIGQVAPDWSRFDEWSQRALEFVGQMHNSADESTLDRLERQARICADIATAASPNGIGAMPRIELDGL